MAEPDFPWAAVPADVGDFVRPTLGDLVDAVIAAVREEVPEYDLPLEGEFGRLISSGVSVALDQFVALLGKDADLPEVAVSQAEALGRAEHRAGRTLDALQSAYRVGARVSWRNAARLGVEYGLDAATMYRMAEAIFAYIDRLAAASVAGYAQEDAVRAGSLQARRHALVELLVRSPPPEPAELEHAATQAGWTLPRTVAVLALGDGDPVAVARRMPVGTIGAGLDPVGLLVVPDPDGPGREDQAIAGLRRHRAVIGPSVPVADARRSAARARAAWMLHDAGRLGDRPIVRADDHLLSLLLTRDVSLADDLVSSRLAPLDELGPGARTRALETLRAWLDAHGDVSAAAETLHLHPQTVRYRLASLRDTLGEALDDPGTRLELALALRVADLYAASASDGRDDAEESSPSGDPPPGNA